MAPERTVWARLRLAALIAGAAFLSAVPYVYYLAVVAFPDVVSKRFGGVSVEEVLRYDVAMVAAVVVLSALAGALFSTRYRLAGFGSLSSVRAAWPWLAAAPAVTVLGYLSFGRVLAERLPGYFPTDVGWAFVMSLKGAVFDEVVARYGMMTILAGVAPRPGIANLLQATFFTAMVFKGLSFFGLAASLDPYFVSSLGFAFLTHLALGHVYAQRGLLAAIGLHFILDLRFVLHALLA